MTTQTTRDPWDIRTDTIEAFARAGQAMCDLGIKPQGQPDVYINPGSSNEVRRIAKEAGARVRVRTSEATGAMHTMTDLTFGVDDDGRPVLTLHLYHIDEVA